jgi:hypothetical protein
MSGEGDIDYFIYNSALVDLLLSNVLNKSICFSSSLKSGVPPITNFYHGILISDEKSKIYADG